VRSVFLLLLLIASSAFGQSSPAASPEERAADRKRRAIEILRLQPGASVADIGCGDGSYTIPLARAVGPRGKVFAVDVSATELAKLRARVAKEKLKNIQVIKGATDNPKLPAGRLDAALIVNAYHEMTAHKAMLRHTLAALKPGGVLLLLDRSVTKWEPLSRGEQTKQHRLAPRIVRPEIERAGFKVVELRDPFQEIPPDENGPARWWLLIARKPPNDSR
jgi:predicted methyltransferase